MLSSPAMELLLTKVILTAQTSADYGLDPPTLE